MKRPLVQRLALNTTVKLLLGIELVTYELDHTYRMEPSWYQAGLNPNDLFFPLFFSGLWITWLWLHILRKEINWISIFFAGVSGVLLCWPKETWFWLDVWLFHDGAFASMGFWSIPHISWQSNYWLVPCTYWWIGVWSLWGISSCFWQDTSHWNIFWCYVSWNEFSDVSHWHVSLHNVGNNAFILCLQLAQENVVTSSKCFG